jgi:DNA polymerase-3 subunit epsilon
MREIILDTESTGLDPAQGHKVVEIGCIELWNQVPTGKVYQQYINPKRDMPEAAFKVHGLSSEFLSPYPIFEEIAEDFLNFIQEDTLVIHNAEFDLKFLNAELKNCGKPVLEKNIIIDTLFLARKKFPGAPASLDALCRRFQIDNSHRDKHGALLDSEILAEVYLELLGGRQKALSFIKNASDEAIVSDLFSLYEKKSPIEPREFKVSPEEKEAHDEFIKTLKEPLWLR